MKTKELIDLLHRLDPEGSMDVFVEVWSPGDDGEYEYESIEVAHGTSWYGDVGEWRPDFVIIAPRR